jgi:UDP-GlcNAc3NAcA epimerase
VRVLTVVGARPQFVKAGVLSPALHEAGIAEMIVHTGQHYDFNMSEAFFRELDLAPPHASLDVGSGGHGWQTGEIMKRLEPVMQQARPDCVLVYGDTNSTLAGALVASKLQIPVAHVEAGLRSFAPEMPEETNRIVADHVSRLLFAPHQRAAERLQREAVWGEVHVVGDLMADLAQRVARALPARPEILDRFGLIERGYGVVTVHREANTQGERFAAIWRGLQRAGMPLVFPVHPRTRPLVERLSADSPGAIIICEPLSYREMIGLTAHARVVFTDSGGLQKEAFVLRVPCVTLREETEWTETLVGGWNRLAGCDSEAIARGAVFPSAQAASEVYGADGCASRIAAILARFLTKASLGVGSLTDVKAVS